MGLFRCAGERQKMFQRHWRLDAGQKVPAHALALATTRPAHMYPLGSLQAGPRWAHRSGAAGWFLARQEAAAGGGGRFPGVHCAGRRRDLRRAGRHRQRSGHLQPRDRGGEPWRMQPCRAAAGASCAWPRRAWRAVSSRQLPCPPALRRLPQPNLGGLCQMFSYPWWVVALQLFTLGATVTAWLTDNVLNFRACLWALATVAIHNSSMACYIMYGYWESGELKVRLPACSRRRRPLPAALRWLHACPTRPPPRCMSAPAPLPAGLPRRQRPGPAVRPVGRHRRRLLVHRHWRRSVSGRGAAAACGGAKARGAPPPLHPLPVPPPLPVRAGSNCGGRRTVMAPSPSAGRRLPQAGAAALGSLGNPASVPAVHCPTRYAVVVMAADLQALCAAAAGGAPGAADGGWAGGAAQSDQGRGRPGGPGLRLGGAAWGGVGCERRRCHPLPVLTCVALCTM